MSRAHTEEAFEDAIEGALIAARMAQGTSRHVRPGARARYGQMMPFVHRCHAERRVGQAVQYAGDKLDWLSRSSCGSWRMRSTSVVSLDVLRNGVKDRGCGSGWRTSGRRTRSLTGCARRVRRRIGSRSPASSTISDGTTNTLDLALFVNGIPVATAELKNHAHWSDRGGRQGAVPQRPRPQGLAVRAAGAGALCGRSGVGVPHYAAARQGHHVPTVQSGHGWAGRHRRCGQPRRTPTVPVPHVVPVGEVWQPDNWLDLLKRFLHVEDPKTRGRGAVRTGGPAFTTGR